MFTYLDIKNNDTNNFSSANFISLDEIEDSGRKAIQATLYVRKARMYIITEK